MLFLWLNKIRVQRVWDTQFLHVIEKYWTWPVNGKCSDSVIVKVQVPRHGYVHTDRYNENIYKSIGPFCGVFVFSALSFPGACSVPARGGNVFSGVLFFLRRRKLYDGLLGLFLFGHISHSEPPHTFRPTELIVFCFEFLPPRETDRS